MDQELQNALAFYQPAPDGWLSGLSRKMEAAGVWIWETIQGDFNDNQTTGQVVTGTIISMIPLVDQICDIRDLVANSKKINEDSSNTWSWVALVLTLVGLFPTFGSLLKGGVKVLLLSGRKGFLKATTSESLIAASIEKSISLLDDFLSIPAVRYTLKSKKIYNACHYLEQQLRALKSTLSVAPLLKAFDELLSATRSLLDTAMSWGPASLRRPIADLWDMLMEVRGQADKMLAKALGPVSDYLEKLANRLRIEGDNLYRARVGDNTHVLGNYQKRANKEIQFIENEKPGWVDKGIEAQYPALNNLDDDYISYIDDGWPDIRYVEDSRSPLNGKFNTFDASMHAAEIFPGEKLYRILDPASGDNSICWMREEVFNSLKSKSDWRRRLAVWKSWNENGEYVVYTVPPGENLKVWAGHAGTQVNDVNKAYSLEGGAEQIVVNPSELKKEFTSKRMKTGWGYQDVDSDPEAPYLGLPDLENKHKWFE